MGSEKFDRDTYSSGAYVEDALRRNAIIFKAHRMSSVLTPMSIDDYVYKSELCYAIAEYIGPALTGNGSQNQQMAAYLKGVDGAYKVAQEIRVLSEVRFALKPVFRPDGKRLDNSSWPTTRQIEGLTNEANQYYFSSEAAKRVGDEAIPLLADAPHHRTAVTFGFAAGLMMAHYGALETIYDVMESDDKVRQHLGMMALCQLYDRTKPSGAGPEAFL